MFDLSSLDAFNMNELQTPSWNDNILTMLNWKRFLTIEEKVQVMIEYVFLKEELCDKNKNAYCKPFFPLPKHALKTRLCGILWHLSKTMPLWVYNGILKIMYHIQLCKTEGSKPY